MKRKKGIEHPIEDTELKPPSVDYGLIISAFLAFVMVLSSIASIDVGAIFQQMGGR